MSELLNEYVKTVISELSKVPVTGQSSLLSDKNLGYAAEWATWEAVGGSNGFAGAINDKRLITVYTAAAKPEQREFKRLYQSMLQAAASNVAKYAAKYDLTPQHAPDQASTTALVDVPTEDADIHVKFNDAKRLAGFQKAKMGAEGKATPGDKVSDVFYSVVASLSRNLKRRGVGFMDDEGNLRSPTALKGKSKMKGAELKRAEKLYNEFQESRDSYRTFFTNTKKNGGNRELFLAKCTELGMEDAIIEDIRNKILAGTGRPALYFKYFTAGKGVNLFVHQYGLNVDDLVVIPNSKETTIFYKVIDAKSNKEYFEVEFRTDGTGHPPQLKVGKDLDTPIKS